MRTLKESKRPGGEAQTLGDFGVDDVDQALELYRFKWNPKKNNWQREDVANGFIFTIERYGDQEGWTLEQYESLDDGYYSSGGWKSLRWTFGSLDELLDALEDYPVTDSGLNIPNPDIDYGGGAPEPDDRREEDY
jgi:hypothetical protein